MNPIQQNQLEQIKNYAAQILAKDTSGHSMDHIERVAKTTALISEQTKGCNLFIALSGAYLHDVIDDKLVPDVLVAKIQLQEFLEQIKLEASDRLAIFQIIDNISFKESISGSSSPLTVEAQVVQDADRLDAIGAIGIGRTFYYGGHKGHKMYDPTIEPRALTSVEDYRKCDSVVNHFYEKLLLLKDQMNTPYAKKIAIKRHALMELFLAEFIEEWQ